MKCKFLFCLFVCLFGVYRLTREFFTHMETSPLPMKGCKILTYARHSWLLSSEGSLACHTHCDTGLPFIMVISEDPWHSHLLPNVWQWSCHYRFYDVGLSRLGFENPTFRLRGQRSNSLRHRRGRADIVIESSSYIVTHRLSKVDGNETYIILNGIIHLLWS